MNKWQSVGNTLLSMYGVVQRSSIDPYQTRKGGIAEVFAGKYLRDLYGPMADIESFTVSQFKDYNQFPEAAPFSGVLDLLMHSPEKMTIEVKSKEMREYERIADHGMFPREQVMQGANQAILAGTTKYMMLWVFLTPALSTLLKGISEEFEFEGKMIDSWMWDEDFEQAVIDLNITMDDFKFCAKEFDADIRLVNAYRQKALDLTEEFVNHRRINKRLFTADERRIIKNFIKENKID